MLDSDTVRSLAEDSPAGLAPFRSVREEAMIFFVCAAGSGRLKRRAQ